MPRAVLSCPQSWLGASWWRHGHRDVLQWVMGPPWCQETALRGKPQFCKHSLKTTGPGDPKGLPALGSSFSFAEPFDTISG